MELVTKVRDTEHWAQVLESSEKKLLVVDAHKEWCGPCKIVEPTYKRLATDVEHAERRLMFATLLKRICMVQLNVGLHVDGIEDNGSCKPRFLLFKDRKHIADVEGANAPQLEQLIRQHLPPVGNDDEET